MESFESIKKQLVVETWPIDKLIPYARNPRKNDEQVDRMCGAIREFGFRIPIVAKSDGTVVDGHLRLKAAQKLGLQEVPVALADELTDTQVKAFRLLANQSANWAEWDMDLLKLELDDLKLVNYDIDLIGFDEDDLKLLEDEEKPQDATSESDNVPDTDEETVTEFGDIWICGNHRLICGDSSNTETLDKLMDGNLANCVFTDPPYGVAIGDKNRDLEKFRNYKGGGIKINIKNDTMPPDKLYELLVKCMSNLKNHCNENACYFVTAPQGGELGFMMLKMMNDSGLPVRHTLIWKKNTATFSMGRLDYDYQHEPIFYTWTKNHKNYRNGDIRTTVWEYDRPQKANLHPTMKPVALVENCLKDGSLKGDIVLDIFGGSGTTMIAAENLDRKARLVELDPHYCDVIIRRWQELTGKQAVHAVSGKTFDEVCHAKGQAS